MLSRMLGRTWYRSVVFWGMLAVSLGLAGVMIYTYSGYRQAATDLVLERDQQLAVLSSARLREELYNFADTLVGLARTTALTSGGYEAKVRELEQYSPRLATFDAGVVLLNSRGVVQAASPPRPALVGLDWSGRDYFKALLLDSQVYISDAVFDGPDGSLAVVISVPILGESGQFEGALAGMFQLGETSISSFYASIVRLRLARSGDTYIVDGKSRIIFDTSAERISRYLTSSELAKLRARNTSGASVVDEPDGTVVAAFAPVPGTNWTLVTEDDWNVLTSQTRRYSNILILSVLAGFLLPPLGLVLFSRLTPSSRIERPDPAHDRRLLPTVQKELRPKRMPDLPGWNLVWRIHSGRSGGSDFVDAILRPDGKLVLTYGNVLEHGIQAALSLTNARGILRAGALQLLSPAEAMLESNRLICSYTEEPVVVHCQFILIDPANGLCEFCSAGMNKPLVCGAGSEPRTDLLGDPLGRSLDLKTACGEFTIEAGHPMALMSRSMLEARVAEGKSFAQVCLPELMREPSGSAEMIANRLTAAYRSSVDRRQRQDGVSLVIVERLRADANGNSAERELASMGSA
jgi:hypothetical protein